VTSWPFAEYVKHAWGGAWICSAFRNENCGIASNLIYDAVAATRFFMGEPPALGMVTFIDRRKVKPTMRRGVKTWGYTYTMAGFEPCGETKAGLLAFRLAPEQTPPARMPLIEFENAELAARTIARHR
jgi:hypothetical protein